MTLTHVVVTSLDRVLHIVVWLVIIRAILSWIRPSPDGPGGQTVMQLARVLHQVTEPLLAPIRSVMPGTGAGLDLSPLLLLFLLQFLRQLLWGLVR